MGDAVKLAEQQKRFLASYIAQNPTSAAAASSIGLVRRIEAILPHPDLKQLREATAAVDAALRQYGLQDNFLLSMNAVDDKPHSDADGGTPANLDIITTDHNRFLLDGSLGDLVLMYTAAPSAPHVVRNLRGDLVFGQGVATACIYEKGAGTGVRDRIQLALGKYALKQLLVEMAPCGFDGAPSVDIVAVERGVFLKQDPAYAAGLLKEVETGHVKPLLSVTDAQAETAIQSVETKRKQLEADIDHDALDGFALVVLPAVQSGPICGALKADLAAHEAILGRIADPAVGRLRAHLSLEAQQRRRRLRRRPTLALRRGVNRLSILTPGRRPMLTPLSRADDGERSPRRSWSGLRSRGECGGGCQPRCLKRQLSLPVSTMSQWWVRRSRSAVVILASPKTVGHSPKARLVVTMTEVRS